MRVLAVASEVYPLVKTGGLADVTGALPPALVPRGVAVRTLLPGYPSVMAQAPGEMLHAFDDLLGVPARLIGMQAAGLDLIVLDAPALFDRPDGLYADAEGRDYGDNWRRFAALARAGAEIAGGVLPDWRPELVHAHDWQGAMTPAYLRFQGLATPTVMTIHNIAFQGHFPAQIFPWLDLPPEAFGVDGVEYYGGVGFLKAGLRHASAITTVSPTYAEEIRTPAFGMGLEGLIDTRADALSGIVNGIDTGVWDPAADPHLEAGFSPHRMRGRDANRRAVEVRYGLDADDRPLFCAISRLTWQKGMDVLAAAGDALVAAGGKLAVLGTGEPWIEEGLRRLAARHRGRVGVVLGYDEPLAHLLQGGADAIVVPSRFEPCGLTQLCGLRYGCVPVVARTGGLADTVIDANSAALNAGVATGLHFAPVDPPTLARALRRAIALHRDRNVWTTIQRQGMKADVSWDRSAQAYVDLYASLVSEGPPA